MATPPLLRSSSKTVDTARPQASRFAWLATFAIWAGLASCGSDADTTAPPPPPPAVASVAITPDTHTLDAIGATVQLTATAYEADGTPISGKTFTWACAHDAIASVSTAGLVTAKLHGSTTISATTDGVDGSATVQVQLSSTSVDVGPEGGRVEVEGFALTVPAGAFDAPYEISVDTTSEGAFVGGTGVSPTFHVSGLPETHTEALGVRIAYNHSLTENSYVVLEEWTIDDFFGDTLLTPYLLSTIDSSAFLFAELPSPSASQSRNVGPPSLVNEAGLIYLSRRDRRLRGVTGMAPVSTPHFKLTSGHGPLGSSTARELLELLQSTLLDAARIGFKFREEDWNWPVEVQIVGWDRSFALLNHRLVKGAHGNSIKKHFLHIPQQVFDGAWDESVRSDVGPQLVFDDLLETTSSADCLAFAIMSWSEQKFTNADIFLRPRLLVANATAPFDGLLRLAESSKPFTRCAGFAPVIKHFVDEDVGEAGIVSTFAKIAAGTPPIDALLQSVNALPAQWWPEFFMRYIGDEQGNDIYNVPTDLFIANVTGTWDITADGETEESFTLDYLPLSAKLFLVKLNADALEPSMSMIVSASGITNDALATIAYALDADGTRRYLGMARSADFEIPELKGYYDNGEEQFLIVVVNSDPYYDPADPGRIRTVELHITLTDCPPWGGSVQAAASAYDWYSGIGTAAYTLTRSADHDLGAGSVTCNDAPLYEFYVHDDGTFLLGLTEYVFPVSETLTCKEYAVIARDHYNGTHADGVLSLEFPLGNGSLTATIADGVLSGEMWKTDPRRNVTYEYVYTFENLGKTCPATSGTP